MAERGETPAWFTAGGSLACGRLLDPRGETCILSLPPFPLCAPQVSRTAATVVSGDSESEAAAAAACGGGGGEDGDVSVTAATTAIGEATAAMVTWR